MNVMVQIIGIIIVVIAVAYLIKPSIVNAILEFFKKGNRLYIAVPIRLGLGILFLLAARECKYPWVIGGFGVLVLISGILVLVLGPKRLRPMLEWCQKKPELFFRVMSLVVLGLGVVIILCA